MRAGINRKYIILHAFTIIIWMCAQLADDIRPALTALLLQFVVIFVLKYKNLRDHTAFIFFQICLFIFVEGSLFVDLFYGDGNILQNQFKQNVAMHIINLLFVGQLFLTAGYDLARNHSRAGRQKKKRIASSCNLAGQYSLVLWGMTYVPKLLTVIRQSQAQREAGYVSSYLGYEILVNPLIIRASYFYDIFFWIYLASKPERNMTYLVAGLNIVVRVAESAGGRRSPVIYALIMTMTYLYYRDISDNKKKWLDRKWMTAAILSLPVIIFAASLAGYYRAGIDGQFHFMDTLKDYFKTSSANVIGYERVYHWDMPDSIYTFGSLFLVMFRNQSFVRGISGLSVLSGHTIEMAESGLSFGQTITYLVNPPLFFRGGGLGGSYYAEAYYDFGYTGVALFSMLYGCLLYRLYHYEGRNVYFRAFAFMMLNTLFAVSRDGAFAFIYNNITLTNICGALLVAFLVQLTKSRLVVRTEMIMGKT